MADIFQFNQKKANRKTKLTVTVILLFLLFSLIFVYINRYNSVVNLIFGRVFHNGIEEQKQVAAFELDDNYEFGIFKDKLIMQGPEGITGISKNGSKAFTAEINLNHPIIKSNGKYILSYDSGGRDCYLLDGANIVKQVTADDNIICADANVQGVMAVAMNDISSLGRVVVYDVMKGQLFEWYSGSNYIVDVSVSPDGGKIAVCTLSVSDSGTSAGIYFFKLNETKPYCTISKDDAIFSKVKFVSNQSVMAISDHYTARYNDDGKEIWNYEYDGGTLQNYSMDESGMIAFSIQNPQNNQSKNVISFLSPSGKVIGTYSTDTDTKYISLNSEMAVLARGQELIVVNKNGNEMTKTLVNRDIKKVFLWGNRDIGVITSNTAVLYHLK